MTLRVGELRHRLTMKHRVEGAADGFGIPQTTDTEYAKAWAKIEAMPGRDFQHADQVLGEVTHFVTMRYRDDVLATDVLLWDDKTLEVITAVDPNGMRDELNLNCKELVPQ